MGADNPAGKEPPAVALLFEDVDQSAHLRDALLALGARIVLEGPVTDVDRDALVNSGADVVVVNLDAAVEQHLDSIHEALDASGQRVVYNDADASGRLSGWDRARWARHLAAKLMDQFDTDPPRPRDARAVPVDPAGERDHDLADTQAMALEGDEQAPASDLKALMAETDDLLAEIQATDAAAAVPPAAENDIAGLQGDDAAAALGLDMDLPDILDAGESQPCGDAAAPFLADAESVADSAVSLRQDVHAEASDDHLSWQDAADAAQVADDAGDAQHTPLAPRAPEWELLDPDDHPEPDAPRPDDVHAHGEVRADDAPLDPARFGIDKVSAEEFLNPTDGDAPASPIEEGLSLELVSLEEAVAPTMVETPAHIMSLDVSTGLRRLVVIGATADGTDLVRDFLRALPARPDVAMLLIQHQDGGSCEALRVQLAEAVEVPVRIAEDGAIIRRGELTLVPHGFRPCIERSGRMRLETVAGAGCCDPNIDAALSAAAAQFENHALAILLIGDADDAIDGAQAIRTHGGRIWLHRRAPPAASALADVLRAKGLIDVEDTPQALAARLIEDTGVL